MQAATVGMRGKKTLALGSERVGGGAVGTCPATGEAGGTGLTGGIDAMNQGATGKRETAARDLLVATGLGDHVDAYEGGDPVPAVVCECLVASRCGKETGARAIRALLVARAGDPQAP